MILIDNSHCTKESDIATLKAEMIEVKNDIERLDRIYDLIYGLTTNVSLLTEQMERNNQDLSDIKNDVNEIKEIKTEVSILSRDIESVKSDTQIVREEVESIKYEPTKKWDWLVKTIAGILVTSITMYLISQTFLG